VPRAASPQLAAAGRGSGFLVIVMTARLSHPVPAEPGWCADRLAPVTERERPAA
jgi:hypothetical protein